MLTKGQLKATVGLLEDLIPILSTYIKHGEGGTLIFQMRQVIEVDNIVVFLSHKWLIPEANIMLTRSGQLLIFWTLEGD